MPSAIAVTRCSKARREAGLCIFMKAESVGAVSGPDAVRPILIFLNLLERNAESFTKPLLAQPSL